MKKIISISKIFVNAWKILSANDPLLLCSATSYFSVFALPSALVILVSILSLILAPAIVSGELFEQIGELFGKETALKLKGVIENMQDLDEDWKVAVLSISIFLIASTTLFIVIQKVINRLWEIKPKSKLGIIKMIKKRLFALLVIFIGGLLALVSVVTDTLIGLVSDFADSIFGIGILVVEIANRLLAIIIVTVWFALIFRLLPDARVKWLPVWVGAFVAAILFMFGKIALGFLFIGRLSDWWGGVSTVVLILIFIFYVSWLVYYGAAFSRAFSEYRGEKILPAKRAVKFEVKENNE